MPASDFIMFPIRFSRGAGSPVCLQKKKKGELVNFMRQRSKNPIVGRIVICSLFAFCWLGLAGCGGEFAGKGGAASDGAVSGTAVSGTVVSGSAVKSDDRREQQPEVQERTDGTDGTLRYCTDTNKYFIDVIENDDKKEDSFKLMQMRWDGTDKKEILPEKTWEEFIGVAAGGVYYIDTEGDLCRIPLAKDKDGYDVVNCADQEKLYHFEEDVWENFLYADERYIFWMEASEDEDAAGLLVTYDVRENKRTERKVPGKSYIEVPLFVYRLGDCYVAVVDEDGIYVWPDGENGWKKALDVTIQDIGMDDFSACITRSRSEEVIFYVPVVEGDETPVHVFDGEKDKVFISSQSLRRAVQEAKGLENEAALDVCVITDLFAQGERLYIQVQANGTVEEKYHMEYLMFSQGLGETELRYEKELTECMWANGQTRTGKWGMPYEWDDAKAEPETVIVDSVVCNDAQCIAMVDGRAYISCYDYKEKKGRLLCYEFKYGDCSPVKRQDLLYFRLYDDGREYGTYDNVYEEEDANEYVGFPEAPTEDDTLEGMFYETDNS